MQASIIGAGLIEIILLLGTGGGLPLGVPPMPEDPQLAAFAPESCLAYVSWAGTAKPDPESANQTEQLLAEPEIQKLVRELDSLVQRMFAKQAGRDGNLPPAAAEDLPYLAKVVLFRPAMGYLIDFSPPSRDDRPPMIRGGVAINLGNEVDKVRRIVGLYRDRFLRGLAEEVEIAGKTFHRMQLPPQSREAQQVAVTWGFDGEYLLVALGEGELEAMLKRGGGDPPQWLIELRQKLPVERVSQVSYVSIDRLLEMVPPDVAPEVQRVREALGLSGAHWIGSVGGLDRSGYVGRTLLAVEGPRQGVLKLFDQQPLTAEDLALVPADATFAVVKRFNAEQVFDTVIAVVERIDRRAKEEMLKHLSEAEWAIGLKLRDDILRSLGDTFYIFDSPGEGGTLTAGLTAVVQLKDAKLARASAGRIMDLARVELERNARDRNTPTIEELKVGEETIHYLNVKERDFPFTPAWCVSDKELVIGLFPQAVRAYLAREQKPMGLDEVSAVAEALRPEGPMALAYLNTQRVFDIVYPFAPIFVQFAAAELQREGIDVNVSLLPSAGSIRRHLLPAVTTASNTDAGIELTVRQSLPGGGFGGSLPVAVALALPAVQSARDAARTAQSMNNLKQIGLAMHNYADVHKHFPPAYSTDKEGKPLLSWRVLILPYVEGQGLYEQFHLDEPWDSEHNKKLIEKMPPCFRSPQSAAPQGKTTYATVRGEDTVFPGKDGVKFSQIGDGTSSTVLTVEVADDKAMEWTKPDDFEYDPENPAKGLARRRGGYLFGFADGSVRRVSPEVGKDWLKAVFTKDGGEAVDSNP
ncbi:MAG: DUF1559 domain-containing protein [Planctomycetota bacterium]